MAQLIVDQSVTLGTVKLSTNHGLVKSAFKRKSIDHNKDDMYSKCVMRIDLDEEMEGLEAKDLKPGDSIDAG